MGLSKAFDSITHDLLIAKMHGYGFSIDAVTFLYLCLRGHKQNLRVSNAHSVFQIWLHWVPQGALFGSLLCNIFVNGLYLWISKTDLLSFADESTISVANIQYRNLFPI